ncbi:DUF1761 domain-containing protein [Amycolatopsis sp. NPDC059657]|uniref:DUF1761 domain-containing protein n=1 Tax=Amycolatopsis sp. NPDC059657 TaxID=3346899 RepID=UPI00366F27AE
MSDVNFLAVGVATVVAFVVSSAWYLIFGAARARLLGADPAEQAKPVPWKIGTEVVRTFVLVAVFATLLGTGTLGHALLLGLGLWIGFPALILTGSVVWDGAPWRLAAIHAGDWLVKLLVIATVVGLWN